MVTDIITAGDDVILLDANSNLQRVPMSVFEEQRTALEHHEFMMGTARGRLAVTLDMLTDALILVGQHGVYCPSSRNPSLPALDLQAILAQINGAKELVSSVMEQIVMEQIKQEREAAQR